MEEGPLLLPLLLLLLPPCGAAAPALSAAALASLALPRAAPGGCSVTRPTLASSLRQLARMS